jgi:hypothetical protein
MTCTNNDRVVVAHWLMLFHSIVGVVLHER